MVIAMDSKFARQLLCIVSFCSCHWICHGSLMLVILQAYKHNIKYPKYLFVTYGTYETQWWSVEDVETPLQCTAEQRAMVLQFSLVALHYDMLSGDTTTDPCQVNTMLRNAMIQSQTGFITS